jgi:hypothetical protein
MSEYEYERIQQLRRQWFPPELEPALPIDQTPTPVRQHQLSSVEDYGIRYQRCGGGRRIIRKAIGGGD